MIPVTDKARLRAYLTDESAAFRGRADKLLLPENEAQVAEALRLANDARTLLTISGGGTSITGARVPMNGGAVLSLERMVRCERPAPQGFAPIAGPGFAIQVNAAARRAIVPPAVTLAQLDGALARLGLAYPPDPTEMTAQTGGTVATNASGGRSFHYGPTRAWVERLRVVLPTGETVAPRRGDPPARDGMLRIGKTNVPLPSADEYPMPSVKNAAGLFLSPDMEPIDLFIGAEGLLGVVTEIEVRLIDRPPHTLTVVVYFGSRDDALDFVHVGATARTAFGFLALEYFDGHALDFMRPAYPDIPRAAAAVMCELPYQPPGECHPYPDSGLLARLETELARHRAIAHWALPGSRREDIRRFRHSLPEAVNSFVRRRVGKIGSDMAVPHRRFREMMEVYEREAGAAGVAYVIFGHAGDDHVHLNFLPEDQSQAARARSAYARLAATAVALGGTISAEHGVGKKTLANAAGVAMPYLAVQYGPAGLRAIARVKNALDPNRILNIGNMLPERMLV